MPNLPFGVSIPPLKKAETDSVLLSDSRSWQGCNPNETSTTTHHQTFYSKWVRDWWLAELTFLALGTAATASICGILVHYDNELAPTINSVWGVDITFNTLIAVLATVGRASLLLPVSECIGQLKWAWFSGTAKPLTELDTFEQSSRGAWGSLALLWRINVRHFVSIGAFLIIFGLAVDPLSQQLVHYSLRAQPDPSSPAYVPTAWVWALDSGNRYIPWTPSYDFSAMNPSPLSTVAEPPMSIKAAIQTGLSAMNLTLNDTAPFCATGNCTWPVYHSLAVCSRWANVTSHLRQSSSPGNKYATRWSLTSRHYVDSYPPCLLNVSSVARAIPLINSSSTEANALDFRDSIAFQDSPVPLADVFAIYADAPVSSFENLASASPVARYQALELVLEWCVQEYSSSVHAGVPSTTRLASSSAFRPGHSPGADVAGPLLNSLTPPQNDTDAADIRTFMQAPRYLVDNATHFMLSNYLRSTIAGIVLTENGNFYKSSDEAEAFYAVVGPWAGEGEEGRLGEEVDAWGRNVATGLSNVIRTSTPSPAFAQNLNMSSEAFAQTYLQANGTAWRDQAFVRVQWGWIVAPALLNVLSILFVLLTIVRSSRQKGQYMVWKSSSLPTLLALGGTRSVTENETRLKASKASLVHVGNREWRLQET